MSKIKRLTNKEMEERKARISSFSCEKTKSFLKSLHIAPLEPLQKEELLLVCEEKLSSLDRAGALVEASAFD